MSTRTLPRSVRALGTVTALSAVLTLGLSACGGSDSSSPAAPTSTATSAPTDAEFVAAANAVCEGDYPDINAEFATLDPSNLDADAVTNDLLPLLTGLQQDLAALTAPDDLATAWQKVIADQQAQLDMVTADPTSLADVTPAEAAKVNDEFDTLGVTSCGSGSGDIAPSS